MKLIKSKFRKADKRLVTSIRIKEDLLNFVRANNINLSATVEAALLKISKKQEGG